MMHQLFEPIVLAKDQLPQFTAVVTQCFGFYFDQFSFFTILTQEEHYLWHFTIAFRYL